MFILFCGFCLMSLIVKAQFWGARKPLPIETPKDSLKKGEFTWAPEIAPKGPILVTVSLDEQMAYSYKNGVLIGMSTISSGKKGHETPTGVFVTTLKDVKHRSSKYNNAAMPYTQRITNYGISLHAGGLPGYPSSHGCIHLPSEYARLLFNESPLGMTVVITNKVKFPEAVNHPSFLSPVVAGGQVQQHERLSSDEKYRWNPELSATGPLSMLLSRADQRMVVIRNGIEIGRCKISIVDEKDSIGTTVYVAHLTDPETGGVKSKQPKLKWLAYGLSDDNYGSDGHGSHVNQIGRVRIPDEFLQVLYPVVEEGSAFMITDAAILSHTSGKKMTILTSHPLDK
jgi:hypothetical protein